ncbi:thioesterase [Shewanella sp. Shew256]|uniref:thioesterase n=1 Tax=Shewanella sp. Shew256 TaxID=1969376 RepID=UPI000B49E748|nr:thioesterase [Shewanella sp. Shew256]
MSLKKFTQYKLLFLMLLSLGILLPFIPDQAYHIPGPDIATQNLHVIEFNDQGQPHNDGQWQGLKARILQPNNGTAPELLIFVHGWHHSANPTDENFVAFEQFYQQMAASDSQRNLLGLYIGWRGDKLDPFWLDGSEDATSWIEPLDFPTILQRKAVAKRIGKTGLSQLLDKLDGLVAEHQLLRYTVIGHSLGGLVVLHASKDRIKAAIDNEQDNPNLFLLLNPAAPAQDFKPLDTLMSLDRQKPSMVVLQSKGDFAVKEAFNYIKDGERALGNSWAITHDIDKCSGGNCSTPMKMPSALMAHDQIPGCMMTLPHSGWKIRARLQARRSVQTCPDANMQAVWVLAVSDEIVSGHNGILTPDHAKALSEVMGMIDLYRNQLPKHAVESPANEDLATLAPDSETTNTSDTQTSAPAEPMVLVEPLPEGEQPKPQEAQAPSEVSPPVTPSQADEQIQPQATDGKPSDVDDKTKQEATESTDKQSIINAEPQSQKNTANETPSNEPTQPQPKVETE